MPNLELIDCRNIGNRRIELLTKLNSELQRAGDVQEIMIAAQLELHLLKNRVAFYRKELGEHENVHSRPD